MNKTIDEESFSYIIETLNTFNFWTENSLNKGLLQDNSAGIQVFGFKNNESRMYHNGEFGTERGKIFSMLTNIKTRLNLFKN